MTKQHSQIAALTVLTLGMVQAADVRIYPDFAEVRQEVSSDTKNLQIRLPQEAWKGVIAGSLDLEGLPFSIAEQSLEANWLSTLEGEQMFWKRGDQEGEQVTLVRARDLLVKDGKGQFFNVEYKELRFQKEPPTNPTSPVRTVQFMLKAAGTGTLSYLTRSLKWEPRYTLKANGNRATLSALADIQNTTSLPYEVKNTELYAGEVNVYGGEQYQMMKSEVAEDAAVYNRAAPEPVIERGGELQGLYRYDLSTAFTLPAHSIVTLPFLQPKVKDFERFVSVEQYFSTSKRTGNLNRSYRMKTNQQLPAGMLTVREDGRIVGETNLLDTRADGELEFDVGRDADVDYIRTVQTLQQEKNFKGHVVKSVYKVTYVVENGKDHPVAAEITEKVSGRLITINKEKPTSNQSEVVLKFNVGKKGKVSKSFMVTIEQN